MERTQSGGTGKICATCGLRVSGPFFQNPALGFSPTLR